MCGSMADCFYLLVRGHKAKTQTWCHNVLYGLLNPLIRSDLCETQQLRIWRCWWWPGWRRRSACPSFYQKGGKNWSDQKQDLNQRRMYKSKNIRRVGVGFVITRAVHIQGDLLSFTATVVWTHCVHGYFQLHLYKEPYINDKQLQTPDLMTFNISENL